MNVRPFSPDEALTNKQNFIPDFVIEAVNEFLAKRFDGKSCKIKQNELIARAEAIGLSNGTMPGWANRQTFFSEHWLDFESIYVARGWKVYYDKPGYNESYEANWTFSRDPVHDAELNLGPRR